MKKVIQTIAVILLISTTGFAQKPCKEVIGYWADWVNNAVDYSKYTIINYAFVQPQSDGSIGSPDATKLKNLVSGGHGAGCKVMLSIGGWTWSTSFSSIAGSPTARQKFASQCASLISQYNLDGVDIDWEYPNADNGGQPQDTINYPLLMKAIKSAIGGKLLSACFSPAQFKMNFIKWSEVANTLDMINMMTYDMTGSWDKIAFFNSALYPSDGGDPTLNINSVVSYLIVKYNVPRNKINIGAPFYGQQLNGSTLFGPISSGAGPVSYAAIKGMSGYQDYWDAKAQVPYMINKGANQFISYDNPRSMEAKGQWVVDNRTRGVIVWETSMDAGGALASALAKGLCNPVSSTGEQESLQPLIFPNPTHDVLNIVVKDGGINNLVSVVNLMGQEVYKEQFNQGAFEVSLSGFENGLYLVRIINENGTHTERVLKQ